MIAAFAAMLDVTDLGDACGEIAEDPGPHVGLSTVPRSRQCLDPGSARAGRLPEETLREIMTVNLDSVFHVTQAVGARMLERKRGRINIRSVASELGRATIVPYAAPKGPCAR